MIGMADICTRIRRVKCDQGRPSCHRCVSSGRICDGYGIWGGGEVHSTYLLGPPLIPPNRPADSRPKIPISRLKSRLLENNEAGAKVRSTNSAGLESCPSLIDPGNGCVQTVRISSASSDCGQGIFRSIPRPLVEIQGDARERIVLFWFKEYTISKAPGLFPSAFWSSLLLRASYSEPAVLQAVLALTSAHKYEQLNSPEPFSKEEQFTLQAYNKAICCLQLSFNFNSRASLRVTLITCILFVCLEIVQRRQATAMTHLSSGLKLVMQFKLSRQAAEKKSFLDAADDESDDLIAQMFLKLSSQANLLGHGHSQPALIDISRIFDIQPSVFISTAEARVHLDKLISQVSGLNALSRKQGIAQPQSTLQHYQAALRADLSSWLQAFSTSGIESAPSISPWRKASCMVLRMYHTVAIIMCETCLFPNQESLFDLYCEQFWSITMCAIQTRKVLEGPKALITPHPTSNTPAIIIDIGWIPALYFTAIKCRIRRIRLLAIRLLESTSHREGIWNATVTAKVAREVMRIEEENEWQSSIDDDFALDGMPSKEEFIFPTLSECERLHDVELIFPDEIHGRARFKYRRRHDDGSSEEIYREHDPVSGSWLDWAS
jgi:hypothetical protein